jgi:hypothetical protein
VVPPVLSDLVSAPNAPNRSGRGGRDHHSKFYETSDNLAEAVIQARPKRRHRHELFAVSTEAYTDTRTLYYDTAQGHLVGRGHPYTEHLNYEVKLVLELGAHHRLRVASYKERVINAPPPREEP